MALYVNGSTITVIREGRRMKVKPTGQAYDFTEAEVTSAEQAGVVMTPFVKPRGPVATAEPARAEAKPETAAQKKAREAAEAKAAKDTGTAAVDDESL